jgi:hypothetical protein
MLDEVFDVEEQTVLLLMQIVEANGTLEPTLDSRKSDGANGVIIVAASRWSGHLFFLLVIIVLLLLSRLLLGHHIPQERDKPCHHDFAVLEILRKLFFQFLNPRF